MNVFVIVKDGNAYPEYECYTSMKNASESLGLSYETVRRIFKGGYAGKKGKIFKLKVNKISGRGGDRRKYE